MTAPRHPNPTTTLANRIDAVPVVKSGAKSTQIDAIGKDQPENLHPGKFSNQFDIICPISRQFEWSLYREWSLARKPGSFPYRVSVIARVAMSRIDSPTLIHTREGDIIRSHVESASLLRCAANCRESIFVALLLSGCNILTQTRKFQFKQTCNRHNCSSSVERSDQKKRPTQHGGQKTRARNSQTHSAPSSSSERSRSRPNNDAAFLLPS